MGPCLSATGSSALRWALLGWILGGDVVAHTVPDAARSARVTLPADRGTRPGNSCSSEGRNADTRVARSRLCAVRSAEPHAWVAARLSLVQPACAGLRAG